MSRAFFAFFAGADAGSKLGCLRFRCAGTNGDIARATRASLWAADAYRSSSMPQAAAQQLKKASDREARTQGGSDFRAALLAEQAAYMCLKTGRHTGPMVRKYAFHLVMAGHMFHKCKQHLHGVRCYQSARSVYADKRWFHVEDHLDFDLGTHFAMLKQVRTEALKTNTSHTLALSLTLDPSDPSVEPKPHFSHIMCCPPECAGAQVLG
jgi:hypothetical protein